MNQSPIIDNTIPPKTKEENLTNIDLKEYLIKVQEQADKISDKFVIISFIIGFFLAPVYETWLFSFITGGCALGIYLIARFILQNKFQARMLISIVYAVFMLQFIGQMHGMAETHFFFFVNAALLIIYQDWRIMIPYAILTVGHHSILAILQVAYGMESLGQYFISYNGVTLEGETVAHVTAFQLAIHFTIVSIMAVVCGWWAILFRKNSMFLMKNQRKIQVKNERLITSEEELKQNIEELETTQNKLSLMNNEMTYNMIALEDKNKIIEEKNKKITSSINYAKRIQDAMLPKIGKIKRGLPHSFVYFKPRDIVSGDFYYYHKVDNKIIIAAIDCTGHGVPGAFMSLIGNDLMNEIIDSRNILTPASILTILNQKIDKVLHQSDAYSELDDNFVSMRDGMDAAICMIDFENNKLEYAGAKNPLVCIQGKEVKVIKGDRISVGGNSISQQSTMFTNHVISIEEPTSFYIYSDGFQDQFGGKKNMKYNTKRFQQTLLDISNYPFSEQEDTLNAIFEEWKGEKQKQIDDILVVGFEVKPT
ncbi:PP2C family protein-serine/threonine phosphatase [Bernardetia sp. OM2101]|uniref:PP2C family protein-serine/threonine phosphatase n=1 Tax=Bernardetia sp. OM2101 TaxID=3344876 RepID=UPI0035D0B976